MEVLLDTSFILTCLKENFDFLDASSYGRILIPKQVILELEKLESRGKGKTSELAGLALEIIKKNSREIKFIDLKESYADDGIVNYTKSQKEIVVATADKELKKRISKRRILVLRARNRKV